jgi:hypothetical protein
VLRSAIFPVLADLFPDLELDRKMTEHGGGGFAGGPVAQCEMKPKIFRICGYEEPFTGSRRYLAWLLSRTQSERPSQVKIPKVC